MSIEDKYIKLGKYKLTFIKWQDSENQWRLWVNEIGSPLDKFIYVCEGTGIEKCLDLAINFLEREKLL